MYKIRQEQENCSRALEISRLGRKIKLLEEKQQGLLPTEAAYLELSERIRTLRINQAGALRNHYRTERK